MKPSSHGRGAFRLESGTTREIAGFKLTETLYPAGLKMAAHSHDPAYFSLVLRGAYTEMCGKVTRTCGPSVLVFHPPDQSHAVSFHDKEVGIFRVEIRSEWLARLHTATTALMNSSRDFQGGPTHALAMRLYREFQREDEFSALAVEGLMLEIIAEASRSASQSPERKKPRWLHQVREILHSGCPVSPTVTSLAEAVGLHPIYLARAFRKHYGCTVGEYVRRLRIEAACKEISVSQKSLSEIAVASGFYDQSHFSNAFKRYMGVTPAQYRARLRSG